MNLTAFAIAIVATATFGLWRSTVHIQSLQRQIQATQDADCKPVVKPGCGRE